MGQIYGRNIMSINSPIKTINDSLRVSLDAGNFKSYPTTGTTMYDLSKNGNNYSLVNGPTFSGNNTGNINLDGVDDYIEGTTDLTLSGNYTLEVAFRRTASRSDWVRIFGHSNDGSIRFWGIWLPSAYDSILWQSYTGGGQFYSSAYSFALNNDYVITFSNSSTTGTFYVNGVPNGTGATGTIDYSGNSSKIRIGYAGFHTYHIGPVYYARIYNKALTYNEVLRNYNSTKTRYGL